MTASEKTKIILVVYICLAVLLLLALDVRHSHRNTLIRSGRWIATKALMVPTVQAECFVSSPVSLAGDRLNLGAWQGHQEVISPKSVALGSLSFDLELPKDAILHAIYAKTDKAFASVRFSRASGFAPACISGTHTGQFTSNKPLELSRSISDGTHRIDLKRQPGMVQILIDGEQAGQCPTKAWGSQPIGFRGGGRSVYVDNVRVVDRAGRVLLAETFSNPEPVWGMRALALVLAALLALPLWIVKRRKTLFGVLATALLLVACAAAAHQFYHRLSAHRYPEAHNFDVNQIIAAQQHYDALKKKARPDFVEPKQGRDGLLWAYKSPATKVLFTGGSQTWGEGASTQATRFTDRVERLVNNKRPAGQTIRTVTFAVRGFSTVDFMETFEEELDKIKPVLLVANHSVNEEDTEAFRRNLHTMVGLCRKRGIAVLLVKEPSSTAPNHNDNNVLDPNPGEPVEAPNHWIVDEVGKKLGVPVLDLHSPLKERRDSGLLWWDHCHLTDYGHRLAAEMLAPMVEKLLADR